MLFRFLILLVFLLPLQSCDQFWQTLSNKESSLKNSKEKIAQTSNKRSQKSLPVVQVTTVKNRALSFSTTLTGTIEAKRQVKIFNQIEAVLIKLPFYEGQQVKNNQTIALLDKTLVQLEVDKAIVLEKQSSLNLNRIKKLIPKNLVSKDEVSQAETLYAIAKTERKKQQTKLSYTVIKAPFTGVISQRLNEPGDVLSEHSHILSLIDTSQLIVKFELSELLLPDIHINDQLNIQIDALGTQVFSSKIIRKHPVIDTITRQGVVEAILSSPPIGAMPGQLSRVHFISKKKNYLSIPVAAIRHDQHSAYVFLFNTQQQTVSKRKVNMGITIDSYIEITNGLKQGDKIIIKGQYGLKSGSKVQIINEINKQSKNKQFEELHK
ncbi:MAG: efflux RND transporter periplasmic adaptor subunit [Pseudomonadota bacterium]